MNEERFVEAQVRGDATPVLHTCASNAEGDMELKTLRDIREYAQKAAPEEACGFVVRKGGREFTVPAENRAQEKNRRFLIDPRELLEAKNRGTVAAVYHSHTAAPAAPTDADRYACEALAIPYAIYSVPRNEWAYYEPTGYVAPLIGREWSDGIQDCYTLVCDYYDRLRECRDCGEWSVPELSDQCCARCTGPLDFEAGDPGLTPPTVYREDLWWLQKNPDGTPALNFWVDLYPKGGMVRVPKVTMRRHDILVMQQDGMAVPHHGAVYLGDQRIVHHMYNSLSRTMTYGELWQRQTVLVLRMKSWLKEGDAWRP